MIKILLDAGHYSYVNRSPVFSSYYEGNMSWKLQSYLKKELESYGFEVDCTRSSRDKDIKVYDRGKMARGYDLFLSLHSNASDKEYSDRAVIIKRFDNNDYKLAKVLALAIQETMNLKENYQIYTKRKSNGEEYFGALRGAKAAGVKQAYIVEHSFHTNLRATKWLYDDDNLKELAKVEAKAIADFYGVSKVEEKTRYLKVLVDKLNIHNKPDLNADSVFGAIYKGATATIIEEIELEGTNMYLTKSGYYVTASSKYVEVFER